jgi:hypothetical protein
MGEEGEFAGGGKFLCSSVFVAMLFVVEEGGGSCASSCVSCCDDFCSFPVMIVGW